MVERPPITHYAKGDLTAARARLAQLRAAGETVLGRPPKPAHLLKTRLASLALTEKDYLGLKARAEFEGCSNSRMVRIMIAQYLRTHRDHLK